MEWRIGETRYRISVANPEHRCTGVGSAALDGIAVDPRAIPLNEDGRMHNLQIVLGEEADALADTDASWHAHSPGRSRAARPNGEDQQNREDDRNDQ
jgi:cyclic beta-1,2-glucan glucanotransferase